MFRVRRDAAYQQEPSVLENNGSSPARVGQRRHAYNETCCRVVFLVDGCFQSRETRLVPNEDSAVGQWKHVHELSRVA
jgi:hypothetical protein